MISFCKIFYVSFIELLIPVYFLYRHFIESDSESFGEVHPDPAHSPTALRPSCRPENPMCKAVAADPVLHHHADCLFKWHNQYLNLFGYIQMLLLFQLKLLLIVDIDILAKLYLDEFQFRVCQYCMAASCGHSNNITGLYHLFHTVHDGPALA